MRVKICGITNIEDALLCENLGANALGFIFYKNSKRYIAPENASKISSQLSPFTMRVGVFVNESPEEINEIAKLTKLNVVQLHGEEKPEVVEIINLPVIKSFRIDVNFNFDVLNEYKKTVFLLDAFSKSAYGGTGLSFKWNLIPYEIKNKIILAGGVSSENIEQIYRTVKPAAVDLSSSLEKSPGEKDEKKVREFFNKIYKLRSQSWL